MAPKKISHGLVSAFFSNISLVSWIIAINFIVFIIEVGWVSINPDSVNYFALNAENILAGKYLWTLFTHMFSHLSFFHLFVNMFSLFFIGSFVEKIIGRKRFIWFYLISGLFAGILSVLLAGFFGFGIGEKIFGNPSISMLGASGAIFGLVGLLAVLVPNARVYLIAGPLIAIILQAVLNSLFSSESFLGVVSFLTNFYVLICIFLMFSFSPRTRKFIVPVQMPFWLLPIAAIVPLVIIGLFVSLPIGNMAHFGGLVAGLIYGSYLKMKYSKKVAILRRIVR